MGHNWIQLVCTCQVTAVRERERERETRVCACVCVYRVHYKQTVRRSSPTECTRNKPCAKEPTRRPSPGRSGTRCI
jgi:hypothetical protein